MSQFHTKNPQKILITGASSGIGRELALAYAKPGIDLALTGRNEARLNEVVNQCEGKGAKVHAAVLDVVAGPIMHQWVKDLDNRLEFDLVIANAGISGGAGGRSAGETADQIAKIFDVNVHGVFNTINPIIPSMVERGRGQIAIMASLAGYRGFPGAPAYGASKAAVKVYGEGLRGALHHTGIAVNVICPGFVKSAMTDQNDYDMPFLMPTPRAAQIIIKALAKNKSRIAFPWQTSWLAWIFAALPDALVQPILRSLPQKSAME